MHHSHHRRKLSLVVDNFFSGAEFGLRLLLIGEMNAVMQKKCGRKAVRGIEKIPDELACEPHHPFVGKVDRLIGFEGSLIFPIAKEQAILSDLHASAGKADLL